MSRYCLCVEYNDFPEWPSAERFDERLEAHLGKDCDGSGFGGSRDITWSYRTKEGVQAAAKKARAFIKKEKRKVYREATVKTYAY